MSFAAHGSGEARTVGGGGGHSRRRGGRTDFRAFARQGDVELPTGAVLFAGLEKPVGRRGTYPWPGRPSRAPPGAPPDLPRQQGADPPLSRRPRARRARGRPLSLPPRRPASAWQGCPPCPSPHGLPGPPGTVIQESPAPRPSRPCTMTEGPRDLPLVVQGTTTRGRLSGSLRSPTLRPRPVRRGPLTVGDAGRGAGHAGAWSMHEQVHVPGSISTRDPHERGAPRFLRRGRAMATRARGLLAHSGHRRTAVPVLPGGAGGAVVRWSSRLAGQRRRDPGGGGGVSSCAGRVSAGGARISHTGPAICGACYASGARGAWELALPGRGAHPWTSGVPGPAAAGSVGRRITRSGPCTKCGTRFLLLPLGRRTPGRQVGFIRRAGEAGDLP